jgi:hypothetical protein
MRALSAADLLTAWERALPQPPPLRPLTLLAAEAPAEDVGRLSVGTRNARLFRLRERLFGPGLHSLASCPACAERLEFRFTAADVLADLVPPEELSGHCAGYDLRFRVPTGADLAALAAEPASGDPRVTLFRRCLLEVRDGERPVAAEELPDEVIAWAAGRMAEADPNADLRLALTCPACEHSWQAAFDVAAFFWEELHAWARGLLREVHTLARAYGWREADVLALSPTRRRFYLELVSE